MLATGRYELQSVVSVCLERFSCSHCSLSCWKIDDDGGMMVVLMMIILLNPNSA